MRLSRRRLLSISGVLMLLSALGHTIGNLLPATDPAQIAVENTMRHFRFDLGMGMNPSMLDFQIALVLAVTITFAGLGVLNLILASSAVDDRLLGRVVWTNIIWVGAFIALSAFYRVSPPLISGILIEIPLLVAVLVK